MNDNDLYKNFTFFLFYRVYYYSVNCDFYDYILMNSSKKKIQIFHIHVGFSINFLSMYLSHIVS